MKKNIRGEIISKNFYDPLEKNYPFNSKVKNFIISSKDLVNINYTNFCKSNYLDIIEPIIRKAATWQNDEGAIIDPFKNKELDHTTPRFIGACSVLIGAGRCKDLLKNCILAMDLTAEQLYNNKASSADFYIRELMMGYIYLKRYVNYQKIKNWGKWLGNFDPEIIYQEVSSKVKISNIFNWNVYSIAGEQIKINQNLSNNIDYIERYIPNHISHFTSYGLYQEPYNPFIYDLSPRFNFSLMLYYGYNGEYKEKIDKLLQRGGLTTLFYISCNGEVPYGGRSNQFNFAEAMVSAICEYEANRYFLKKSLILARAFKRAAHISALSTKRWLVNANPIRHIKNFFLPKTLHGCENYATYSKYLLTAASFFAVAYLFANDRIKEGLSPIDIGGYIFLLPEFHKVFATVKKNHIEIDLKADDKNDCTGLSRFHRASLPSELGLSSSIISNPEYNLNQKSKSSYNIGPAWRSKKKWNNLASISKNIENSHIKIIKENQDFLEFLVYYILSDNKVKSITTKYSLKEKYLKITSTIEGDILKQRFEIPILITDGKHYSNIEIKKDEILIHYLGHSFQVKTNQKDVIVGRLNKIVSNRNALYDIGFFECSKNIIEVILLLR